MFARCEIANAVLLPALRIAVAKTLSAKYGMRQEEIALALGISQASVNKYLNGRYSARIGRVEERVESEKAAEEIVKLIISNKGREKGKDERRELERLAESDRMFRLMERAEGKPAS